MLQNFLEQNASREYIRELYSRSRKPLETYPELVREFQDIENMFRLVSHHGSAPRTQPNPTPAPRLQHGRTADTTTTVQVQVPSTSSGTHAGPMDVSAARGPLSDAERQRRRAGGLCLYCGQPGHLARTCPLSKRTLRVAEAVVSTAPPSPRSPKSENGVSLN